MRRKEVYIVRSSRISSVKIAEMSCSLELVVDGVVTLVSFNEIWITNPDSWKKKLRARAKRVEEAWVQDADAVLRFHDVEVTNAFDSYQLEAIK